MVVASAVAAILPDPHHGFEPSTWSSFVDPPAGRIMHRASGVSLLRAPFR